MQVAYTRQVVFTAKGAKTPYERACFTIWNAANWNVKGMLLQQRT